MTPTVELTNELIKSKFTDALAFRSQYIGDLDDCPTGEWIIRQDTNNANMPLPTSGHLSCSRGSCSLQRFTTSADPVREFVRTKWYSNNWGKWYESQMIAVLVGGGGKTLFINHLRNFAERRVA